MQHMMELGKPITVKFLITVFEKYCAALEGSDICKLSYS
jgi:hypothetical protein